MAMMVLVAYDVVANSRRARVATRLQEWGSRLQKSVFLLELDKEDLEALKVRIASLIDDGEDSIFYLPICTRCLAGIEEVGQAEIPEKDVGWFIA